jgi:maleate cis-trans isomerase
VRDIEYGDRLRLGIIVPSGNVIAEPQIAAMLPPGVAAYFTRLRLRGSSEAELMAMVDGLDSAAGLLADAEVDLLVFHCTAVTTYTPSLGTAIREKMRATTGIPSLVTSEALTAAFQALTIHKLVLLSPYLPDPHRREIEFVASQGVNVIADAALGIDTNLEMATLSPDELYDFVIRNRHADADGYFLSCTALRSLESVAPLEAALGRPVITSNQAMVWHALRRGGVADPVEGFGRLLLAR